MARPIQRNSAPLVPGLSTTRSRGHSLAVKDRSIISPVDICLGTKAYHALRLKPDHSIGAGHYRAVDRDGNTLDFMLSEHRNLAAARRFFKRAISTNGVPDRVVLNKSGTNLAGLQALNVILKFTGVGQTITIRQVKYLNNILEQDHCFLKRITGPLMGFKAVHSAAAALAGIETTHMIRKGQFGGTRFTAFQQFAAFAT